MERSNEVILQNAILENVLRYLFDKLKGIRGKTIETIGDDGTIYAYCVQNVFPSNSNKIEVKYTSVITPQGNLEKAHGYWGDLIAMSFEGLQLQTNTVLIKAECKHPFIVSIFDRYWDDLLKYFGALQPAKIEEKIKESNEQDFTARLNKLMETAHNHDPAIIRDAGAIMKLLRGPEDEFMRAINAHSVAANSVKDSKQSTLPLKAEKPTRKVVLNQACIDWVNRGYISKFTREEFLQDFERRTGAYITLDEFKRALRDAHKHGLISKDKGRFRPKTSP